MTKVGWVLKTNWFAKLSTILVHHQISKVNFDLTGLAEFDCDVLIIAPLWNGGISEDENLLQ